MDNDKSYPFRAPAQLLAQAKARSKQDGVSLARLIRLFLEGYVAGRYHIVLIEGVEDGACQEV